MSQPLREAYRRYPRVIVPPAAGAEFSVRPDGQGGWRLVYLEFTFTASAVVANRTPTIRVSDGTQRTFLNPLGVTQAAASVVTYVSYPGITPAALVGGVVQFAMPDEGIILNQSWILSSLTGLIDVGDTYTGLSIVVEELPTGPTEFYIPTQLVDRQPLG